MTPPGKKTSRKAKPKRPPAPSAPAGQGAGDAARFSRTRQDHAGEIAEDYVELIAQLIRETGQARTVDLARGLGVSHVTVTKTIARLQREGLVRTQPYRSIFLTEAGEALARETEQRHELLLRFLRKLGVESPHAEIDAEGMEHHVSPATLRAIRGFLDEAD